MEEYRETVRRLAGERSGESFYNNSPGHAAIIFESLLGTAEHEICFITTALNPDVFGQSEVVDAAQRFLSNGSHRMRILFEQEPNEAVSTGHPFVQEINQHNNIEARQLPPFLVDNLPYHFAVADADSFRFEPDKSKWEASAAFGDERNGRKLQSVFDSLWESAIPAHLPREQLKA
jgi:hypothetical protein